MIDKSLKLSLGALLLCAALCPVTLWGQDSTTSKQVASKPKHHPVEVTGCLQKTDEAGEFSITGEDGKTWDLRSESVKLSKHVGHKVTVTGSPYHETQAEEAKEEKAEKNEAKEEKTEKKEAAEKEAHLRVTGLKMISESCSK